MFLKIVCLLRNQRFIKKILSQIKNWCCWLCTVIRSNVYFQVATYIRHVWNIMRFEYCKSNFITNSGHDKYMSECTRRCIIWNLHTAVIKCNSSDRTMLFLGNGLFSYATHTNYGCVIRDCDMSVNDPGHPYIIRTDIQRLMHEGKRNLIYIWHRRIDTHLYFIHKLNGTHNTNTRFIVMWR